MRDVRKKEEDYKNLVVFYENLVALKPDNLQYHVSLAFIYSKTGDIGKAVTQAKITAELNSSFEAEARAFVKSLGQEW